MGIRNNLIEGVSGTGKTSVATELQRRGCHVVHGDRELALKGDPQTGVALTEAVLRQGTGDVSFGHRHHIWNLEKVTSLIADKSQTATFFCGGSRNFHQFIHLFDAVFVLSVDRETLKLRLESRSDDEFGGKAQERDLVLKLHATGEDIPAHGTVIDAGQPLERVVDDILIRLNGIE